MSGGKAVSCLGIKITLRRQVHLAFPGACLFTMSRGEDYKCWSEWLLRRCDCEKWLPIPVDGII